MKCLSVQQPWAWAIVHGPKRIENRTWKTNYRGPLLIHASKGRRRLGDYGSGEPLEADLVFGAIIGQVQLLDCVPIADVQDQRFAEGPWCWVLGNARALPAPVPYTGCIYLFDVPAEAINVPTA
jgi:hypothetical protein